jgi:hypothetical protein
VCEGRCDPRKIERSISIKASQVENADKYVEARITHLIIGFGGANYDRSPLREVIAWRDSQQNGS